MTMDSDAELLRVTGCPPLPNFTAVPHTVLFKRHARFFPVIVGPTFTCDSYFKDALTLSPWSFDSRSPIAAFVDITLILVSACPPAQALIFLLYLWGTPLAQEWLCSDARLIRNGWRGFCDVIRDAYDHYPRVPDHVIFSEYARLRHIVHASFLPDSIRFNLHRRFHLLATACSGVPFHDVLRLTTVHGAALWDMLEELLNRGQQTALEIGSITTEAQHILETVHVLSNLPADHPDSDATEEGRAQHNQLIEQAKVDVERAESRLRDVQAVLRIAEMLHENFMDLHFLSDFESSEASTSELD